MIFIEFFHLVGLMVMSSPPISDLFECARVTRKKKKKKKKEKLTLVVGDENLFFSTARIVIN